MADPVTPTPDEVQRRAEERCETCRRRIITMLKERERPSFTSPSALVDDLGPSIVKIPKEQLAKLRNDYGAVSETLAQLLGVSVENLCVADMLWRLELVEKLEAQLAAAQAEVEMLKGPLASYEAAQADNFRALASRDAEIARLQKLVEEAREMADFYIQFEAEPPFAKHCLRIDILGSYPQPSRARAFLAKLQPEGTEGM